MMMTTEGALTPDFTLNLSDVERLWWLERCIRHNERREEEMENLKLRR